MAQNADTYGKNILIGFSANLICTTLLNKKYNSVNLQAVKRDKIF